MAEVLGAVASGLTVAGLFKVCIEAFDLIQTARRQDADLKRLILRFNIEKCRLYVWGETMGLTTPPVPGQTRPLESFMFEDLVCITLQAIVDTFQDTQKMKQQYGCRQVHAVKLPEPCSSDPVKDLAAAFSDFNIVEATRNKVKTLTLQTRWIVHDRKRFAELITEAKTLIDGLQEITKTLSTVARQEGMMRHNIQQVRDVDTLQLVADVSQKDYPEISDSASMKVDILTMASNQRLAIEAWADDVAGEPDDGMSDIESMTVTELKHRLRLATAGKPPFRVSYPELIDRSGSVLPIEGSELHQLRKVPTNGSELYQPGRVLFEDGATFNMVEGEEFNRVLEEDFQTLMGWTDQEMRIAELHAALNLLHTRVTRLQHATLRNTIKA
ncbi:MAG: hypothetical protein Q9225_002854 [Loekoesia sp. 1 TL-2023]